MNRRSQLFGLLVCAGVWSIAAAATAAPAAPDTSASDAPEPLPALREPIVPRMPENASWSVQYAGIATAPAARGTPPASAGATAIITKNGTTYRVRYTTPVSGYSEVWSVNNVILVISADGASAVMVPPDFLPACNFASSDFEDFAWLDKATFRGKQNVENRDALVFEARTSPRVLTAFELKRLEDFVGHAVRVPDARALARGGDAEHARGGAKHLLAVGWGDTSTACLDPATQLPFQLVSGDKRVTVTYLPAPPPLAVPEVIRRKLAQEAEKIRATRYQPSRLRP